MFCGECGTQNPDSNQFCRNCGKPLIQRQPAAQPAAQPAPVPAPYPAAQPAPVPAAPSHPAVAAAASGPVPGAVSKHPEKWLGIVSLVFGILSWAILTVIFAIGAILLGVAGTFLLRKATGRIGISGIIGIVLGIAAIAVKVALA
ncbi:MAG: zinc ribbon domain-containing protein [Methanoregula sp.]